MTIITKPLSEKKGDKLGAPLVDKDINPSAPPSDAETGGPNVIHMRRPRRVTTATTLCLLLTALLVVSIGIVGGTYLYRQYLHRQYMHLQKLHAEMTEEREFVDLLNKKLLEDNYRGWAKIPYDGSASESLMDDTDAKRYFQEEFEISGDSEKIDVPNFQNGRRGRFIHDFNTNMTGIMDVTNHRCFVMPLNRENILPPNSLFDLMQKMLKGYYRVNTDVVRHTMRVVTPPITDVEYVGSYIAQECANLPVYKLEKFEGGVVKRSADLGAQFSEFSGKGIMEVDIVNYNDLAAYEKRNAV